MSLVRANIVTVAIRYRGNDSPLVIGVFCDEIAVLVGDAYNVILRISDVVVLLVIVAERADTAVSVGVEVEARSVGM